MNQTPGSQQPYQPSQPHQQPMPGQPMPGQPFAGYPVPTPPRKGFFARHKILTAFGVVVLLAIVISAASGGPDDGTPSAGPGAEQEPAGDAPGDEPAVAEVPGIGDTVADGKLEFTVTQVETGVTRVGDDMFGQDAQGQFVLVHVQVRNIGDESQLFDGSSQQLVDTQGRQHSADSSAAIYLGDANSFLNQINPGNQVDGIVVFDVPADAQLASITLHDSPFSGGVTVGLS